MKGGQDVYRFRKYIHVIVFVLLVAFTWNIHYNPFVGNYLQNYALEASKDGDLLYEEIKQKGEQFNEQPEDAYIDRVWKKTPGRNGIRVNVKASYEKMKKSGTFNDTDLVFEEISPDVSLSDLKATPIYRGHPKKKMVALLINVSWGTEHLPKILHILKKQNIKATFFLEGKWAKENVDFVKMIDEEGHTIGNHAYNHPDMAKLSNHEIKDQIEQTNEIIKAIIEKDISWFAPPSGSFSEEVVKMADNLQMETILWTVDTIDWKKPSVSVMLNRVTKNIHPGATILMHPTPVIANGLNELITQIKEKGYRIGSIDQLLSEKR